MEILSDKIIKFTNAFSPSGYIDLIEDELDVIYNNKPYIQQNLENNGVSFYKIIAV